MLSTWEYLQLRKREAAYVAWSSQYVKPNGWTIIPGDAICPADATLSNDERSSIEVFEFIASPPEKYFLYIHRDTGTATTWTGDKLGSVTFGKPYRDNFGGRRVPVWINAINGRKYHGTYFESAGDYARIKMIDPPSKQLRVSDAAVRLVNAVHELEKTWTAPILDANELANLAQMKQEYTARDKVREQLANDPHCWD